jgi:hypothetical protein
MVLPRSGNGDRHLHPDDLKNCHPHLYEQFSFCATNKVISGIYKRNER